MEISINNSSLEKDSENIRGSEVVLFMHYRDIVRLLNKLRYFYYLLSK